MPTEEELTAAQILLSTPTYWVVVAFVAIFGLIFGSFFNVAIYRLPIGLSVTNPKRSFCFRCGSPIAWSDNIPVVSWFLLGGRCRSCGTSFSGRYAFIEFLTALLFCAVFIAHNPPGAESFSIATIWYMAFVSLLLIGTFTDFDHWIVPKQITQYGAAAAFASAVVISFFDRKQILGTGGPFPAMRLMSGDAFMTFEVLMDGPAARWVKDTTVLWWEPLVNAVLGGILAPILLWGVGLAGKVMFKKEAMGFGDVELFIMIGATVGFLNSVLVLMLACMLGLAGWGSLWLARKLLHRDKVNDVLILGRPIAMEIVEGAKELPVDAPLDAEQAERGRNYAEGLEMEFLDLARLRPMSDALAALPATVARKWNILPLSLVDNSLRIAAADIMNTEMITELKSSIAGRDLEFAIAAPGQITTLVERHYGDSSAGAGTLTPESEDLLKKHLRVATAQLAPKPLHPLPFIPWIALASIIMVVFYHPLRAGLSKLLFGGMGDF